MPFLTSTKCERRQFTWSHMTDSDCIACLFILINTFREVMVRLQPTVWGEGMGNIGQERRFLGIHLLCV